jgi:hypothetical protein
VREAFELALDRDGICRSRWTRGDRGQQWSARKRVLCEERSVPKRDVAKAKALLARGHAQSGRELMTDDVGCAEDREVVQAMVKEALRREDTVDGVSRLR